VHPTASVEVCKVRPGFAQSGINWECIVEGRFFCCKSIAIELTGGAIAVQLNSDKKTAQF
jgi:hypothetical protein